MLYGSTPILAAGISFSAFNNIHNPLAVGAWHLVDIIYHDGTGGPGGVTRTQWMVDGFQQVRRKHQRQT